MAAIYSAGTIDNERAPYLRTYSSSPRSTQRLRETSARDPRQLSRSRASPGKRFAGAVQSLETKKNETTSRHNPSGNSHESATTVTLQRHRGHLRFCGDDRNRIEGLARGGTTCFLSAAMRRFWPWLCAILSGALLALCYPPANLGGLSWLALTPLIAALWFSKPWKKRDGLRLLLLGYATGLVYMLGSLHWLDHASPSRAGSHSVFISAIYTALWALFAGTVAKPRQSPSGSQTNLAEVLEQPAHRRARRGRLDGPGMAARCRLHRIRMERSRNRSPSKRRSHPNLRHHRRGRSLIPRRDGERDDRHHGRSV